MTLDFQYNISAPPPPPESKYDLIQDLVDMVNISEISSIRQSVSAIIRVIHDPMATVKELKSVILLDPPLTARVLKTANSAYYSRSFSSSFVDIEQAIIWMGSEIIKELALNQKVCEIFDKADGYQEFSRKSLWSHSIAVALMVKAIYRKEYGLKGENAYVAGLLHDLGIIAEDQFLSEDFREVIRISQQKFVHISAAEQEMFGYDHADIGAAICLSWGLPDELVSVIGNHNTPGRAEIQFSRLASTLYISDYICQNNGFNFGVVPKHNPILFKECLQITELQSYGLDIIFKSVKEEMTIMMEKGFL